METNAGASMKREIREVDPVRGIRQETYVDERWYARQLGDDARTWDYVPSVTWITNAGYVRGIGYYKWLAKTGWSEAEDIKTSAGEKGSKVHQGVHVLASGGTVGIDDSFTNPNTLAQEPVSHEEYRCLMSFVEWCEEEQPQFIALEYTVWNERYRYAGTVDIQCRLKSTHYRAVHLIDVKTSPQIWPAHELQLSAYKHADPSLPKGARLGILQLGYRYNKIKKYKYTPIADQFDLFLAARKIWEKETTGQYPLQREYPLSLSLVK